MYDDDGALAERAKARAIAKEENQLPAKDTFDTSNLSQEWLTERLYEIFYPSYCDQSERLISQSSLYDRWLRCESWRVWAKDCFVWRRSGAPPQGERSPLLAHRDGNGEAQGATVSGRVGPAIQGEPGRMRGAPPPATSTGYYTGLTALLALGALSMGGLAFYLYYGPSKVAAALIAKYQIFAKLAGFLKINITFMGPLANGLMTTEFILTLTSSYFQKKTSAQTQFSSQAVAGWVSAFVCLGAFGSVIPIGYMAFREASTVTAKALSLAGMAAAYPSAYLGFRKVCQTLTEGYRRRNATEQSEPILETQKLLVDHLTAELEAFVKLPQLQHKSKIQGFTTALWNDAAADRGYRGEAFTVLKPLLTISGVNTIMTKHDFSTSRLTWGLGAFLSVLRVISLFGFTLESWRAGAAVVGKKKEISSMVMGAFTATLTAAAGIGLSIITIPKIAEQARKAMESIQTDTAFTGEAQYQSTAYYLAFFAALYTGVFSGGTSALAAEETLGAFGEEGSGVFQVISYVTTGCIINAVFINSLFQRIMSFYSKKYGNDNTKQFTTFIAGFHNVIDMIKVMSIEQFRESLCQNTETTKMITALRRHYGKGQLRLAVGV